MVPRVMKSNVQLIYSTKPLPPKESPSKNSTRDSNDSSKIFTFCQWSKFYITPTTTTTPASYLLEEKEEDDDKFCFVKPNRSLIQLNFFKRLASVRLFLFFGGWRTSLSCEKISILSLNFGIFDLKSPSRRRIFLQEFPSLTGFFRAFQWHQSVLLTFFTAHQGTVTALGVRYLALIKHITELYKLKTR